MAETTRECDHCVSKAIVEDLRFGEVCCLEHAALIQGIVNAISGSSDQPTLRPKWASLERPNQNISTR